MVRKDLPVVVVLTLFCKDAIVNFFFPFLFFFFLVCLAKLTTVMKSLLSESRDLNGSITNLEAATAKLERHLKECFSEKELMEYEKKGWQVSLNVIEKLADKVMLISFYSITLANRHMDDVSKAVESYDSLPGG